MMRWRPRLRCSRAFYLRFEGGEAFYARLPLLLRILPLFVVFSVVICYVFNLTTTKWRFISLPDALNIMRVATRSDGSAHRAGLCLHFRGIERQGAGAVRPYHHRALLVSPGVRAERAPFRLSLFPLFARSPPCPDRGGVVDPVDRPRRRCRGAVARRSRAARSSSFGRSACCRRRPRTAASRSATSRCSAASTMSRTWSATIAGRGKPISRIVMTPSAFEPEAHPEAVLMRAKRLGLFVSRLPSLESGDVPRLTNVAVEDLLLRPSEKIDYARLEALVKGKAVIVTGGGGSIGSEICDRVATFGAARLLVIEHSEPALYAVTEALAARADQCGDRGPDRRYPRSRPDHEPDARIQARYRVPCRRPQARADPRARLERGRQDQHLRFRQRRRRRAGGGRRRDGDDLDRQGDRAGLDAGPDQALCRNVLPGARPRPDDAIGRQAAHAADLGAVRQRAGLERIGGAEIQGADRGRRPGHGDASGHGPLLHDHPRSLRSRADRGDATR